MSNSSSSAPEAGSTMPALAWNPERDTIAVNVLGFAGMVNVAVAHLEARVQGTSLASLPWLRCAALAARPMAKADRQFWVASPQTAARQIATAIRGRKRHVYITRRWRLIAWLMQIVPDAMYSRL